jgi:hypothetical protein
MDGMSLSMPFLQEGPHPENDLLSGAYRMSQMTFPISLFRRITGQKRYPAG